MEDRDLQIVITGHIDHGKSTLVGRLFFDTGSIPPDRLEDLKNVCTTLGKKFEFAFLMDHLEEEREKGITIDIAHTYFKSEKRRYVIIDAPGHKEFLKNMITGTSQAEAALLLVDAAQGIQEQTLRHCYVLSFLGIKQVAVVVNKMDSVEYSEKRFNEVKADILKVLADLKVTPSYVLPISAYEGDNVAKKSENLSWYDGPTVLEALDSFKPLVIEEKGLRFPVQDQYDFVEGGPVAVGRVEAGVLHENDEVFVLPGGRKEKIREIKKFNEQGLTEAPTGECVGVRVQGGLKRGEIVVDKVCSTVTDSVRANIFWMVDETYELGIPITLKCATQEAKGKIDHIYKRFDPATIKVVEKDANQIKAAEIAEVEIKLDREVVVDKFSDIPEMGRFVLEHDGYPIAGGIII